MLEHKTDNEGQHYTTLRDVIDEGDRVTMKYESILSDSRHYIRTQSWWQRLLKVIPASDMHDIMKRLDRNNEFMYDLQKGIKLLRGDKLPKLPSADWGQLASLTDQAAEYATYCTNEGSNLEDKVSDVEYQLDDLETALESITRDLAIDFKEAIEAVRTVADELVGNASEIDDHASQLSSWVQSEIPQELLW